MGSRMAFMPLEHCPGDAQVDFGTADFYENGTHFTGKYLELSFPHSNNGYTQLNYGENAECLLEGLDAIFRHMGCVPERLWLDNTKTIVTKILRGGGRELTERYQRFREHYGFKDVFTNPGKGNEKGNVENKVGYSRRNFLVPVPSFKSLEEFNRQLLETCDKDSVCDHYRRNNVYKVKTDGTRNKMIAEKIRLVANRINVAGDWIFYKGHTKDESGYALFRIKTDGTNKEIIVDGINEGD